MGFVAVVALISATICIFNKTYSKPKVKIPTKKVAEKGKTKGKIQDVEKCETEHQFNENNQENKEKPDY